MGTWDGYRREERKHLEPGDYRVKIVAAEEAVAKTSGNPMIVITVQPNGSDINIKNYLVKNEYFNRNATDFFDSFDVEEGDFFLPGWVGALGAAKLEEDDNGYLRVRRWISKAKAEKLPPWEGETPQRQTVNSDFEEVGTDEDLPF